MKGRQGTGREITKYDGAGQRLQNFSKGKYAPMVAEDLDAVLESGIRSLKTGRGRICKFEDSQAGLDSFVDSGVRYLQFVRTHNEKTAEGMIFPTVEGFCSFAGITRQTLINYGGRGDAWHEAVDLIKGAILASKVQLTNAGRIPPIFSIFDLVNNHGFMNTSEFKLRTEPVESHQIQTLDEIASSIGLEDTEEG